MCLVVFYKNIFVRVVRGYGHQTVFVVKLLLTFPLVPSMRKNSCLSLSLSRDNVATVNVYVSRHGVCVAPDKNWLFRTTLAKMGSVNGTGCGVQGGSGR
jgi:hypothetical protein